MGAGGTIEGMHAALRPLVATDISVGTHIVQRVFGLHMDLDALWATGVVVLVVVAFGVLLRRQATSGVPGKFQLAWEMGIGAIKKQVQGSIGPRGAWIVPLATSLFVFILLSNFLELFTVGSKYEILGSPSADVNLPGALAIFVIILVHIASLRSRGIRAYASHYFARPFQPKSVFLKIPLLPFNGFINVVEEIARPITLALRLFGNLFSGALMLALIAALGAWKLGAFPVGDILTFAFNIVWKLFDVFLIGPIQAFIFALLTILYFDSAMSTSEI